MKIFISGKGGSGKSTVSALLAKEMAKRGRKVLVVDNDESNFGLHSQLGLDIPKDFMYFFGGKKVLFEKSKEIQKGLRINDLPDEYLSSDGNLNLLVMGKIREYGEGCACPINALTAKFMKSLSLKDDEILITDMDAGTEHFGRKVEEGADVILVVVDPTRESIKLSKKITDFGEDVGKNIFYILNKVDEETEKILSESLDKDKILGIIPQDERIFKACLQGEEFEFQLEGIEELSDSLIAIEERLHEEG